MSGSDDKKSLEGYDLTESFGDLQSQAGENNGMVSFSSVLSLLEELKERGQLAPQPTTGFIYDYFREVSVPEGFNWHVEDDEDGYPVDYNDMLGVWVIKDGSFLERTLLRLFTSINSRCSEDLTPVDAPACVAPEGWNAWVHWKA